MNSAPGGTGYLTARGAVVDGACGRRPSASDGADSAARGGCSGGRRDRAAACWPDRADVGCRSGAVAGPHTAAFRSTVPEPSRSEGRNWNGGFLGAPQRGEACFPRWRGLVRRSATCTLPRPAAARPGSREHRPNLLAYGRSRSCLVAAGQQAARFADTRRRAGDSYRRQCGTEPVAGARRADHGALPGPPPCARPVAVAVGFPVTGLLVAVGGVVVVAAFCWWAIRSGERRGNAERRARMTEGERTGANLAYGCAFRDGRDHPGPGRAAGDRGRAGRRLTGGRGRARAPWQLRPSSAVRTDLLSFRSFAAVTSARATSRGGRE